MGAADEPFGGEELSIRCALEVAQRLGYHEVASEGTSHLWVSDAQPGVVPDLLVLGYDDPEDEIPKGELVELLLNNGNSPDLVADAITQATGGNN